MAERLTKIKLKGNETFNFREGWLRKGMRCVQEDPTLFSQSDVMERLGVGSKMVKSIRFWLQATGLCIEKFINSGRGRAQFLTEDFGMIIDQYDRYFEDFFTLTLLHYKIVSNQSLCIAWNLFFNSFMASEFTREDVVSVCSQELNKIIAEGVSISEASFADDCSSVIKMYLRAQNNDSIEEDLSCPLSELGLIKKAPVKGTFFKAPPSPEKLDMLAVYYVIIYNLPNEKNSVSINDLLYGNNNIGKVFNLSRIQINEYLDQLRAADYLQVNRTAGLDMVYIKNRLSPKDIMITYYKKAQV